MKTPEDKIIYRYFGIEFRIVFYFTALFFLLLSIISFKSLILLSLACFFIFLLITLLTYLDSTHHFLIIDEKGLILNRLLSKNNLKLNRMYWSEIINISTREYGIFKLLKTTQLNSPIMEKIKVFSFMEDYYHFLKDICERAKNAEIDELTKDLLTGQADY